jgi:hypothetical protein
LQLQPNKLKKRQKVQITTNNSPITGATITF